MGSIIETFGLNSSFYYHFAIFIFLFFALKKIYFGPFMNLFHLRHKKTIEDRQAAEALLKQADQKLKDYQDQVSQARLEAKKEFEKLMAEAKAKEDELLGAAREEAKKITQDTVQQLEKEKKNVRSQLKSEVDQLSNEISERLLKRV